MSRPYDTRRWRRLRVLKLRDCPWCEYCPPDRKRAATQVDHARAIADGGDPWAWENLKSVCAQCHSRKTGHGERLHGCGEDGMPRDGGHWWNINKISMLEKNLSELRSPTASGPQSQS